MREQNWNGPGASMRYSTHYQGRVMQGNGVVKPLNRNSGNYLGVVCNEGRKIAASPGGRLRKATDDLLLILR